MKFKEFMKEWGKGTKRYAESPRGQLEATIIISAFIAVGCFLGAWERHLTGDGTIAFILFAIGLLQLLAVNQSIKAYKGIVEQEKVMFEAFKQQEEENENV